MTLRSAALKGVKWTSLSSAIIVANDTIRTVVLARLLVPDDFGLMAMVAVVIGFAQMYTDLGLSAAVVHHQEITDNELSSLYWLNVLSGLIVFAAVWAATPLIPYVFHDMRVIPLTRALAFVFLITPISSQFEILLQKQLEFKSLAVRDIS